MCSYSIFDNCYFPVNTIVIFDIKKKTNNQKKNWTQTNAAKPHENKKLSTNSFLNVETFMWLNDAYLKVHSIDWLKLQYALNSLM